MIANIKSYIPILRWRAAEMKAIKKLSSSDRENVTPLVELVMPSPSFNEDGEVVKTQKDKFLKSLPDITNDLFESCGQNTVFLDAHLLDSDIRASSLEQILSQENFGLFMIPVTYIIPVTSTNTDKATREIAVDYAKKSGHGLCIRIDKSHLQEKNIMSDINNFVESNKLNIENTDLFIDLRVISDGFVIANLAKQLAEIPNLKKWRSFTIAGGVFPKDLTQFTAGIVHPLDRLDLKLWNALREIPLPRVPSFSDYTIQCPDYEPVNIPGSVSIRYTADENWWIFRGKKPGVINKKTKEKGPGREQYIGHATTLKKRPFYKGSAYSFGDAEIARIAEPGNIKTGNPTTWLTIGINHHITLTGQQIASLVGEIEAHSTPAS